MSIHIETHGSGPDLVLLHGWGLHGGLWRGVMPALAEHHRVHAVDLPGHGRSPLPANGFTLENVAATVADAVPANAAWVGWSLGGMVALAAALAGEPISKLVLLGALPRFTRDEGWPDATPPEVLAGFAADLADDYKTTLNRFLALQCRGSERAREELRLLRGELFAHGEPAPEALSGGLAILQQTDLRHRLAEIRQPCLLLQGERDTLAPLAAAEQAAAMIPDNRLQVIKGAGHAPFISHPDTFVAALRAFIDA